MLFLFPVAPNVLPFGFAWFNSSLSSPSYLCKQMGLLGNSMGGRQELLAPHPGAAGGDLVVLPYFLMGLRNNVFSSLLEN